MALWLFCVAALVIAMVVVGGATRLTGSGLSITEWRPLAGAIPPLNPKAWNRAFQLYQATAQYHLVNRGMSLAAFQSIYWWEWAHRFLGRLVGVAFAAPLAVFALSGRLRGRRLWACLGLFLLGTVQGAVGWWMVRSGLEGRIAVAPERLATHLGLALLLIGGLVWVGADALTAQEGAAPRRDGWRVAAELLAAGAFLQCLLGALVAGNKAGLIDNDWPLMGGHLAPGTYAPAPVWISLLHDPATVQFNHRAMAYAITVGALAIAARATASHRLPAGLRRGAMVVAGLVLLQAAVGVATLMNGVPLVLAIMHQALAAGVWSAAVILAWRSRQA